MNQTNLQAPATSYTKKKQWNPYARLFGSVTTSVQLEVYYNAIRYLQGDVADFGCGTAKIAPLLLDKPDVSSYTGIDYSEDMVGLGQELIGEICPNNFRLVHSRIEDVEESFTSGVSIQSYYSWPDPEKVLEHIFKLLQPNAKFVLATVNENLDIVAVLEKMEKELIGHPDWQQFKQHNLALAENAGINAVRLDHLVKQVQGVGFSLIEAHQKHFWGGLNFLVLKK